MGNVIHLEAAFNVHAQLLDWLQVCLRGAVDQGLMRASQSRELREAAEHVGISQLRCILDKVEKSLVARALL
jgi:hypothetical protein